MSALLAALQRLEGRTATSVAAPSAVDSAPVIDTTPVFFHEPISPFAEPLRSMGWDEVTLPADLLPGDATNAQIELEAEPTVSTEVAMPTEAVAAPPSVAESNDGTAALADILHAPALAAVVTLGVNGEIVPLLRHFGEALSARTMSDVVLLGPGMLDDTAALTAQWKVLSPHVGYGLVHASAERALLRIDALRQTAGVICVVELGRTPTAAVEQLRTQLAERNIPLLGTLAIRDDVA